MISISQFNLLLPQLALGFLILMRPVGTFIEENSGFAVNLAAYEMELPPTLDNGNSIDDVRQFRISYTNQPTVREEKQLKLLPSFSYTVDAITFNRKFAERLKAIKDFTAYQWVDDAISENDALYYQWLFIQNAVRDDYVDTQNSLFNKRAALVEYVGIVGETNYYCSRWPEIIPVKYVPYK